VQWPRSARPSSTRRRTLRRWPRLPDLAAALSSSLVPPPCAMAGASSGGGGRGRGRRRRASSVCAWWSGNRRAATAGACAYYGVSLVGAGGGGRGAAEGRRGGGEVEGALCVRAGFTAACCSQAQQHAGVVKAAWEFESIVTLAAASQREGVAFQHPRRTAKIHGGGRILSPCPLWMVVQAHFHLGRNTSPFLIAKPAARHLGYAGMQHSSAAAPLPCRTSLLLVPSMHLVPAFGLCGRLLQAVLLASQAFDAE